MRLALEYVPTADLRLYHQNPRVGDPKKIAESLQVNGQYRALAVNKGTHTGRPNEVLAGNHTLLAVRDLGWSEVGITWVDVDDDQAARIVLADNRTSDVASYEDRLLAELLAELPDLDGTGYDPGDLDDLVAAIQEETPGPGDGIEHDPEGMRDTHTLDEDGNAYADTDTRMIILAYPLAEFETMVKALAELGERYQLDSNAAVVAYLVKQATG
jgi:hypothetical protein